MSSPTLTLVKEDGSAKADANSYASLADANWYHLGHLYATAWSAANDVQKTAALVMATRLIDGEYQFGGNRCMSGQALQWPRLNCREPDGATSEFVIPDSSPTPHMVLNIGLDQIRIIESAAFVPADVVPKAVVEATCELARELLIVDRTASHAGEGLSYYNNAGVQTGYDKSDTRPIIPAVVQAFLSKYGSLIKAKSGSVQLIRT